MKKSIKNFVICSTAAVSIGGAWCCADEVRAAEMDLTADENFTVQTEEASPEMNQAIEEDENALTETEQYQESEEAEADGEAQKAEAVGEEQKAEEVGKVGEEQKAEEDAAMLDTEVSEETEVNSLAASIPTSENNNVVVWDNASGKWCVKNGEAVNTSYTGVAQNESGWWYIRDGYLDWDYTGVAQNEYGWWYIRDGYLDWNYTGVAQNEYGWWYVQNGALDWNYTGVAQNEYGWWYISKWCIRLELYRSSTE